MSVINRRNAVVGWLTLVVGKRLVAKKVKSAVQPESKSGKARTGMVAAVVAGAVGVATFLRLRSRGGDGTPPAAEA